MQGTPSLSELMESASLPTIPAVAVQIIALVQREDLDIDVLADTISHDPALAARVLKTANSGFYGRPRSVKKMRDAVMVLGLRSVKTLALGFSLVGDMRRQTRKGVDHTAIWQRSLLAAAGARTVATRAGYACADEAFLGGLLHLIGVVAMDQALGPAYRALSEEAGGDLAYLRTLERERFGFDHAEAGAALAEKWNLPEALVMAIRMFPRPDSADHDFRDIVRCVATADAGADLTLGHDPAGALTRFRWDCQQLFGIQSDDADLLIARVIEDASVLGSMLDVPDAGVSAETVLTRAHEALLQLTLETERENAHLHAERDRLTVEASTDGLTGLANRRHLEEYLTEQFRISSRYGTPLSVVMLDIDHFKAVNDTYGHPVGDQVLRNVAKVLTQTAREADLCARYGGEEFVVVLPATPMEGALELAERVRASVEATVMIAEGKKISVTISAGVNAYRKDGQATPDWLIKEADMALYDAKRAGRNRIQQFAEAPASPWSLVG
ncbi:MAG: GGDEF domain-containing protein [bacterium]